MQRYKLEPVSSEGLGIIKLGDNSFQAKWTFDGLERWIESRCLDGSSWRKGLLEYGKYLIWFDETPSEEELPETGTTVSLMIDEKKIGDDRTWWVIAYLEDIGKIGVELSNRPSG